MRDAAAAAGVIKKKKDSMPFVFLCKEKIRGQAHFRVFELPYEVAIAIFKIEQIFQHSQGKLLPAPNHLFVRINPVPLFTFRSQSRALIISAVVCPQQRFCQLCCGW